MTRNEKEEEYVLLLIAHMKQRLLSSEEENVHSDDEDYDLGESENSGFFKESSSPRGEDQ